MDPQQADLFTYLLRLGDDRLILGHRLSEWSGAAPILEEDIALSNIALDCLGQADALLGLAGEIEDRGRCADDLAYFREAIEFRNCLLVESPNGDFAHTMMRQFLFDGWALLLNRELTSSPRAAMAGIAAKAVKESAYHLRHSRQWVLRLAGGTEESHRRSQQALDNLWRFTGELFAMDEIEKRLHGAGLIPDRSDLLEQWNEQTLPVLSEAGLRTPDDEYMQTGGYQGRHTEHLGHLLAEMQIVARSHPGAAW